MIEDVRPHRMTGPPGVVRPAQPRSLGDFSVAELADEHRGQSFAKERAADRLQAIEAEMQRRGNPSFRGTLSETTRHENGGLVDLKRLRKDHPELCARYAQPGTGVFYRSRTLRPEERS